MLGSSFGTMATPFFWRLAVQVASRYTHTCACNPAPIPWPSRYRCCCQQVWCYSWSLQISLLCAAHHGVCFRAETNFTQSVSLLFSLSHTHTYTFVGTYSLWALGLSGSSLPLLLLLLPPFLLPRTPCCVHVVPSSLKVGVHFWTTSRPGCH